MHKRIYRLRGRQVPAIRLLYLCSTLCTSYHCLPWWFCFLKDWIRFLISRSRGPRRVPCMLPWRHYIRAPDRQLKQWLVCFQCCWSKHPTLHHYGPWMSLYIVQRRHPTAYMSCQLSPWGSTHQWNRIDRTIALPNVPLENECTSLSSHPKF